MEIKVKHSLSREKLAFLLDSAGRGASYWCENVLQYETEVNKILRGGESIITDRESEPEMRYAINLDRIERGLTTMARKSPQDFADILTDDYDNNTGDVFLQYCVFDELVYQ